MTALDLKKEAVRITRAYSFELEQRLPQGKDTRTLNLALIQTRGCSSLQEITDPWRLFFAPNDTNNTSDLPKEIVVTESDRLRKKWLEFYQKTPKQEQVDMNTSEPTIDGVVKTVNMITAQWQAQKKQGRFGRTRVLFHKLCGTLNSHSALIKLLPEGSEYISVFTGTLHAIIKASANHERIAESIAQGLVTISENIQDASRNMELNKTIEMQAVVTDLYQHVFLFLNDVMDWILEKRSKRLLDSFKENFHDKFEKTIKAIHKKTKRTRDIADHIQRADTRALRATLDHGMASLERDRRLDRDETERHREELRYRNELLQMQLEKAEHGLRQQSEQIHLLAEKMETLGRVGQNAYNLLETVYQGAWQEQSPLRIGTARGVIETPRNNRHMLLDEPPQEGVYIAEDIAYSSRHLEDFFSRERVRLSMENVAPAEVGIETLAALSEWVKGERSPSGILWLEGPVMEEEDFENPLTITAAKVIALTEASRLPVVSYFCNTVWLDQSDDALQCPATIALLYALIRQMVELLLPRFETSVNLSDERFRVLDGSFDTWHNSLTLFRDLITLLPGTTFFVIDGIQWLDDHRTDEPIEQLIECLRDGKLRVLFTTTGRSGCLASRLEPGEIVALEEFRSQEMSFSLDDELY